MMEALRKRDIRPLLLVFAVLGLSGLEAAPAAAAEHRLGGGVHYWKTVDELADDDFDIDDEGVAWVASYQYVPVGLFKLEVDVEYFPSGFGGSPETAWSPQLYLVLGGKLYGAVGAGVVFSEGYEDSPSDPFYAARLGLDLTLLPRTHLDVHANYRFNDWNEFEQADTDTITLGALLRFAL
ncbi:MAG TPA: hypothetical protein VEL74_23565 [Thermoanaerobaculia bacterium]|nr:hypothetical protein [Thermoanaerobaculia bacterium]